MARKENKTIGTIDDVNATQQIIRAAARRLIERWDAGDMEIIIRATERAQTYLKELRAIEHTHQRTRQQAAETQRIAEQDEAAIRAQMR